MKISNTPRWVILFSAVILTSVGFVVLATANQNIAKGPYVSTIPSPGYEGKFLAFSEIGFIGGMIAGIGVLLGLICIGVQKWPRSRPKEFYIDGIKTVGISVASMDYEKDKSVIQNVMRSTELMVHVRNEFSISDPESKMGWNFFVLHVTPNLIGRVADHIDMQQMIQKTKPEDVFVDWLAEKLKEKECNVYLDLESRKHSSKYGLF
jgi:hypothetical protein